MPKNAAKNLAVLFADLVGSTSLYQQRGDAYAVVLVRQNLALLKEQLKKHDGTLIKEVGDAVLVTFPKVKKALACAMAMQRSLQAHNREVPQADRLQIRVGVHHGAAIVEKGDLYGEAANLVARIEEKAGAGEICASQEAWNLAHGLDTEAEEMGRHQLKGLAGDMALRKVLWDVEEIDSIRKKQLNEQVLPRLVEALGKKRCVLVLGGYVDQQDEGCSGDRLARSLSGELGIKGRKRDFAQVATEYQEEHGRAELVDLVIDQGQKESSKESALLHLLARIPFDLILSTETDDRLEQALHAAGRKVRKFTEVAGLDLSTLAADEVGLIKIFGDQNQPESLALTEEEVLDRLGQFPLAAAELRGALAIRELLFLGHAWGSHEYKRLGRTLLDSRAAGSAAAIGISPRVAPGFRWRWRRRGLGLHAVAVEDFLAQIPAGLSLRQEDLQREAELSNEKLVSTQGGSQSTRPYKFLSYFEEEDQEIFFGRKEETSRLFSQVVSSRLVLLHAPSGAGKSSLLHAGLVPRLKQEGYLVIVRRAIREPQREIREAVLDLLGKAQVGGMVEKLFSADLQRFLKEASARLEKPLVIILDQFEEFFIRFSKKLRQEFAGQLGAVLRDKHLPVRLVLSMRHDFLHHLAEFKAKIPDVYHHEFGMENLSPQAMAEAIVEPALLAGLRYQPNLLQRMLADLGAAGAEPPQLQILCDRLYDELEDAEEEFTLKHYERLGGVEGILGGYLERFLDLQSPAEQEASRKVLKAMVTSLGTKSVVSVEVIGREVGKGEMAVSKLLNRLIQARLVRKLSGDEVSYELSHECLIEQIGQWIAEKELDLKKARELLRQEMLNYEKFGMLMSPERLAIVRGKQKELNLSKAEKAFVARSERSRRRRRQGLMIAVTALLALAIGGSYVLARYLKANLCQEAAQQLSGVWDQARKAQVRENFLATKKSYAADTAQRVESKLDRYASAWVTMRTEACYATHRQGTQSEHMLDLRMRCLDAKRGELSALTELFASRPDPKVLKQAVDAAYKLSDLNACADTATLSAAVPPPQDAASRAKVQALQKRLDHVLVLERTAQYQEALTIVNEVEKEARPLAYQPLLANTLFEKAKLEQSVGKYQEADKTFCEAMRAGAYAKMNTLVAKAWNLRIAVLKKEGKLDQALAHRTAAEVAVAATGDAPNVKAAMLNSIAEIYYEKAEYDQALALLQNALKLYEKNAGADNKIVAMVLNVMGNVKLRQGDLEQARNYYARSLSILEKIYGPKHPKIVPPMSNLGLVLNKQGRYPEARVEFERALAIELAVFGEEHPGVATTMYNLANVLMRENKRDPARKHFSRALAIREKLLGPEHPKVATLLIGLGDLAFTEKRYPEGLAFMRRALAISEKALGPQHPNVGITLLGVGRGLARLGKYAEAVNYYDRALPVFRKALGEQHVYVAYVLSGKGSVSIKLGDFRGAKSYYQRSLAIFLSHLDPAHPDVLDRFSSLAEVYGKLGEEKQALATGEKIVRLCRDKGCQPESCSSSKFRLARLLWKQSRDRARALTLAKAARQCFAQEEARKKELAEVDAWLLSHPVESAAR